MLKVVNTSVEDGQDVVDNVTTIYPPVYLLHCEDSVDNKFMVETDKKTFVQVTDFLDKLRSV